MRYVPLVKGTQVVACITNRCVSYCYRACVTLVTCSLCLGSKLWCHGRTSQVQQVPSKLVLLGKMPEGKALSLSHPLGCVMSYISCFACTSFWQPKCSVEVYKVRPNLSRFAGLLAFSQARMRKERVCRCCGGEGAKVCCLDAQAWQTCCAEG